MHGDVDIKRKIYQIIELILFNINFSNLPLLENCKKKMNLGYTIMNRTEY